LLLHPAQKTIARDTHRFRVVDSGRRFGKTVLAVEEMTGKAVAKDDQQIAYIAPTYQQARDIAWELLKKKVLPVVVSVNESRLEIVVKTQFGGKSKIVLRGWESIETLRGQRYDFVVIDEIAQMRNFETGWQEVIRPTLTDTKGETLFISTPKGYNHFYDLFNQQDTDTDYRSFKFTTYDNPYIPVEEIDKAKQELPEDRFAQEYLADFRKMEGLVYKEFDRERHTYNEQTIRRSETILGVDFGYTNPACVLEIVRDNDNHYWVKSEWYKTGKTNIEIIEYCKSLLAQVVYPDPAEPDRIEEMRRHGLNTRDVNKDIPKGIDAVRELFKQNRIHIHSSCKNLILELETYAYPDKKDLHNEEERPIKENDHAVDALRYALFMNQPIKNEAQQYNPWAKKAA
jgi:PBSX family phage terminase large subunit